MSYEKNLYDKKSIRNQIIKTLSGTPQSFAQIFSQINIDPNVLREEIKKFELEGIVQNFLQKLPGQTEFSYFEITEYGKKLLNLNYSPK